MRVTIAVFLLAYLVGSVPSGYLLVRAWCGRDVREYGSHNVGAINVFRVGGPGLGSLTLLADAGKALGLVLLASAVAPQPWAISTAAFLVMLGHAYSAWFFIRERRFSEGKSVACGLGVLAALACLGALPGWIPVVPISVWAAGLIGPRVLTGRWPCISPATMAATLSVPLVVWIAHPAAPYVALAAAMAALILVRHRNNIRRLRAGTEPRLGERAARPPEKGADSAKDRAPGLEQ